jgi:tRNA1(Val) A37 N6-methylase TrmN6
VTTTKVLNVPIYLIEIFDDRQRKDFGDIEPLKGSLQDLGLINPISVASRGDTFYLLAGGRRLAAATALGWKTIRATVWYDIDDVALSMLVELDENLKRKQLDWKEEALACLRLHDIHCGRDEEWHVSKTADVLNCTGRHASRLLGVARALENNNEAVHACTSLAAGAAALSRQTQRIADDEAAVFLDNATITVSDDFESVTISQDDLNSLAASVQDIPEPGEQGTDYEFKRIRSAKHDIVKADFREWARDYRGPAFQVIHLDPPYGIGHNESEQGGGAVHGTYSDAVEDFWNILDTLLSHSETLIAPRSHIVLWFSMKYYYAIIELFRSQTVEEMQFVVNQFPLIWHKKDNIGLVPDAKRYGRRVYETALLISVGDRQINAVRPNLISWPSGKADAKHLSEKPQEVVNHFLYPLIEPERKVNFLDPCCGSGTALSAAEMLGAVSVTGLDLSQDSVDMARRTLNARRLQIVGVNSTELSTYEDDELLEEGE